MWKAFQVLEHWESLGKSRKKRIRVQQLSIHGPRRWEQVILCSSVGGTSTIFTCTIFLGLASPYRLQRLSSSEHSAGRNSTSWKRIKDGPFWKEKIAIFREYPSLPSKTSLPCIPALNQLCFKVIFPPFSYQSHQGWITFSSQNGQMPIIPAKFFSPALPSGGEGDDRGWDGWMASPTQWTWVWVNSSSW